ncbi:hypothetical protein [Pseudomonas grimontii]
MIASSLASGCCFKSFGFEALEPEAEAVAFPIQNLHAVAWLVEEDEKHRVEYRDFDIQFDQRRRPSMDFRKSTGLG